jgi:hypothetical protein
LTQPLLDVFGRNPEQFVFRGADRWTIIAFALGLALAPPLVLWGIETLAGLAGRRVGEATHLALVTGLSAVILLRLLKRTLGLRGAVLVAVAGLVAVGVAVLWARFGLVRQWARYASMAVLVFVLLFLVASPTGDLVRGQSVVARNVSVGEPHRVVMIVFDEFPLASLIGSDGEIDAELYPNIAQLAGASDWFRNATTVASSTGHAVGSILSGRYPADEAPVGRNLPDNLFTLLGGSYDMRVTESISRFCPTSICDPPTADRPTALRRLAGDARTILTSQIGPGDEESDPVAGFVEEPAGGFGDFALDQPDRVTRLLDSLEDAPRRSLHYLHILLPHVPWRYTPSGAPYVPTDEDPGKESDVWTGGPWPPQLGRERHLAQVGFVDRLIGRLVERLRATGTYDDTLLMLTADHGVAFQAGQPVRGLESDHFVEAIHPEIMWIPLFVKRPGQNEGRTLDTNVQTIDVLPTIADVLGIEVPWEMDGRSAFSAAGRTGDKTFFQNQVNPFSVSRGERAVIDGREGWSRLLERTVDSFLPGSGPLRFWRVGPRPELVGRRLGDLEVGAASTARAALDTEGLDDVRPRAEPLPALVTGHLEDAASDEVLAFTLNGTVAAVAPTFTWGDRDDAFAVLLPDELFRPGANRLEVHAVGPGDRLAPVAIRR